jgi:hypothetical protein
MRITSKGLAATLGCEEDVSRKYVSQTGSCDKGGPNRLTDLGLLCDKGI